MSATHQCGECGAKRMLPFKDRTVTVEHGRDGIAVKGLSGWQCEKCGETEFDPDSAARYARAGDALVEAARPPGSEKPGRA